jgi:hypothetical protein
LSDRFGGGQTGGTSGVPAGNAGELSDERFGTEGGGTPWSSEALFLASLVDVDIPTPPIDGYVLTYDAATSTWVASAPTGGTGSDVAFEPEIITVDIDFVAQDSKDVMIPLGSEVRLLLLGRLYIDSDPGGPFNQWTTYTFYNKGSKRGADAYYRNVVKIAYTELEIGTTGIDHEITPDDHTVFGEIDLVKFLDNNEYARIETVADTLLAEDVVGVHGINTGLVRVSEFSGLSLFNDEYGTIGYLRVAFGSVQTVSLRMDLILVK